jgi:hypothetical protein
MEWNSQLGWEGVFTFLGFIAAVVSLIYAAREVRRNTQAQRAGFLLDLTERYFQDDDVRKFYYKIDYNEFVLDFDSFIGSDEERWLDSLLYTFDVIGSMVRMRVVTISEVKVFAFQAFRVLRNPEVEKYLAWLDNEYKREGRTQRSHDDARYLVERLMN